ncbi:hypothetical protein CLV46_2471 [Diaminobutyricimonas aerilata]|uniref:Uncharacterized protein n=2 Tax=Diaminobutyricimonas aerilata TaxID=1162967 RepID=A0A2M9CLX7_9MICO|nr:hypothetical protein CLV46_2471 [Diaminobutyricimonas aerilata]
MVGQEQRRITKASDIGILPFAPNHWRIVDKRSTRGGMDALIGFLTRRGDVYEVARIGQPHVRSYCADPSRVTELLLRPHTFMPPISMPLPDVDRSVVEVDAELDAELEAVSAPALVEAA